MQTIHKYNLRVVDIQTINLPKDAIILSIQNQNGSLSMWCLIDTNDEMTPRTFRVIGTGERFEDEEACAFLATVQCDHLVWHIFEQLPKHMLVDPAFLGDPTEMEML